MNLIHQQKLAEQERKVDKWTTDQIHAAVAFHPMVTGLQTKLQEREV